MTIFRRHAFALVGLVAIALTACSTRYGSSSSAAAPPTTTTVVGASTPALTKAADLRASYTYLLVEHAYLLAAAISTTGSDAAAALTANTADIAQAFSPFGAAFTAGFTDQWNARIADIEAYAKAKAAKDTAGATAATTKLATDETTLATAFHTANKYLPIHTVTSPATGIGDELGADDQTFTAWIDAATSNDATTYAKLVTAAESMPHTADVLASAVAKLDPKTYPGTPTGTAANLRASLTTLMVEHVELSALTFGAMAQGQQAGPQRVVLDANSLQLHNAFASLYDDNTANDASALWSKQLDAYDAEAKAGGQDPQAVSQLSDFATQFGAFVNRVTNNNVDAQTLTGQMQAQAADLTNVIAGAATNASDVFARVRTAAANAPIVAATLAEGFALQMPTRFLA